MQLLTFTVAGQTYAIESRRVVEVLPLVPARPIPHTPAYIRGIFTYRGRLVPLVDLGQRLATGPLTERLSTRVIVVEWLLAGRDPQRLGLVAENVISICSTEDAEASLPSLDFHDAPFLGNILRIGGRTIQLIAVEQLLPSDISTGLFPEPAAKAP
jgi:chemotaxis-related protein WspB